VTGERLAAQRAVLAEVLDTLVPESGGFPGAGAVALDHVLAMAAASAEVERLLAEGLQAVEAEVRASGALRLASLGVDEREALLRRVERAQPESFDALVKHTYDGYYVHPRVLECLGLDASPPHPRGHEVETVDLPDLARVTARGPLYRSAP
jgi:Gluconate 2-dehydrogenase subunit 3